MSTIKITDATVEPITLQAAKDHLRETLIDTANDDLIQALIKTVRQAAEDRLGRTLLRTTWRRILPAFPAGGIKLYRPAIIDIEWLKYIDQDGAEVTMNPSDYLLADGLEPGELWPAYGTTWPVARLQHGAVAVQYRAGYGDAADAVPAPIVHWMKLALTDLYENRARSSERPSLPQDFADGLLDVYRVWSV